MIFLGIYGDQFPLYFPECVAQFPLSGKDHIVVSSNLNLSGASLIRISPFFSAHYTPMAFIYSQNFPFRRLRLTAQMVRKRLCCWAGLTPGNNESAGKKKSIRITCAGVYLKPALVQCAHAAVNTGKYSLLQNEI